MLNNAVPIRIQKLLSQQGLGSRREIEQWIKNGWVKVNGTTAQIGQSVIADTDKINVKGKPVLLKAQSESLVLLYNKPEGEECSRNPQQGIGVFNNLPKLKNAKWINVGRLDINTSGLLLFTNDGDLANKLMHPSYQIPRQYLVRVYGKVTEHTINKLLSGVQFEDGTLKFEKISLTRKTGNNSWFKVMLTEGKNRECRRLWESQACKVSRLIRVKFGSISLPRDLKLGQTRFLSSQQVAEIKKELDNKTPTRK